MVASTPFWDMASIRPSPHLPDGLVDRLLQSTLRDLAQTYAAEVALWTGLEASPDEARAYFLGQSWHLLEEPLIPASDVLRWVELPGYPQWLMAWKESTPQVAQLDMGDLLVPIVCLPSDGEDLDDDEEEPPSVPLVVHLRRTALSETKTPLLTADLAPAAEISGWTEDEVRTLTDFSRNLAATFQQAVLQERLSGLRRQSALVGRVTHLLNSSLEPDGVLQQILAELGRTYGCDRSFILDLRDQSLVSLTAQWSKIGAVEPLPDPSSLSRDLWASLIDPFLQDGASYQVLQADEAEPEAALCEFLKAEALFLVPIFLKTEFFGVLALDLARDCLPFRMETLQTFYQVADHIAIALSQILNAPTEPGIPERRGDRLDLGADWCDPLTRLPSRDALEQELLRLSHATLWPTQADFSVLLIDIDYFKLINDTYGNRAGDEVLQGLAQRLQHQLRQGTLLYRYGGEEFLILLNRTTLNPAADVAERLRATVQQEPVKTSAGPVEVTVSFGVVQRDRTRDADAHSVVKRAEQALLEAKCQGRNRIKVL